jgi:hypothetical protein
MSNDFYREPIFWSSTVPGYNTSDRERRSIGPDGREIVERVPQIGHQGDYENKKVASGVRYIEVVRHEGHVVALCLTNAAAHLDPSTGWGQQQRGKAHHFGWFPIGLCPVALLGTGELQAHHVKDRSLLDAEPCKPGTYGRENRCPHNIAEQVARSKFWGMAEAERAKAYKDPTDRLIEANQQQQREFAQTLAEAIKANSGNAVPSTDTDPPARNGKKGG